MNNTEPYGFNSMPFGEQDDYLDQFGYNDTGKFFFVKKRLILDGYSLDGRESPDANHWNSINSGGDMDIDR
jgi:hypothetical protein